MGARIALVEDDDFVRELVVAILSDRGYEVEAFASVRSARKKLAEAPPDLVITDVELPDGTGIDLVGQIRDVGGKRVPTIVLSSLNKESDFARGFAAGAVDYLSKPFSREELLARCAVHLARANAAVPPSAFDTALPETGGLAFGRYRVERLLGRGGYGQVFLAHDAARDDMPVALKVLAALSSEQEEVRLRFIRETYTLASVDDPRVAAVYDSGSAQGRTYFAMEYVEGMSLDARVRDVGPISEDGARALTAGLLGALAVVARAGLVHRDLKPANVMLRQGRVDTPVLVDFGLAKRRFDRGITDANVLVGTPEYMAPEVILGRDADERSDLFALGLTVRFALTGEGVFPALRGVELLTAIARDPIPPIDQPLTPPFAEFLETLMARDLGRRFPNAEVALRALEKIAESAAESPPRRAPAPAAEREVRKTIQTPPTDDDSTRVFDGQPFNADDDA